MGRDTNNVTKFCPSEATHKMITYLFTYFVNSRYDVLIVKQHTMKYNKLKRDVHVKNS